MLFLVELHWDVLWFRDRGRVRLRPGRLDGGSHGFGLVRIEFDQHFREEFFAKVAEIHMRPEGCSGRMCLPLRNQFGPVDGQFFVDRLARSFEYQDPRGRLSEVGSWFHDRVRETRH